MKVYHRTNHAKAVMRDGFTDSTDTYMTENEYSGVWLSDVPLDVNEGAVGADVLQIDLPDDIFTANEWVEEGKPYREALVPAATVNAYLSSARLLMEDEVIEVTDEWREAKRTERSPIRRNS